MFFSTCFSTNSKNYSRIEVAGPLGLVLCHRKLTSTNGLVSYLHKYDLPTKAWSPLAQGRGLKQEEETVNYLEVASRLVENGPLAGDRDE